MLVVRLLLPNSVRGAVCRADGEPPLACVNEALKRKEQQAASTQVERRLAFLRDEPNFDGDAELERLWREAQEIGVALRRAMEEDSAWLKRWEDYTRRFGAGG